MRKVGFIAAYCTQYMMDITALHLFHRHQFSRIVTANQELRLAVGANFVGEIFDHKMLITRQSDGTFDGIAQFPHIARPSVRQQLGGGALGDAGHWLAAACRAVPKKVLGQQENIRSTDAERGNLYRYDVQYLCQLRKAERGLRGMNTPQAGDLVENLGQ
jgi:hypothetical protein